MKKMYKKVIIFICLIVVFMLPQIVFGSDNPDDYLNPADQANQTSNNPVLEKLNEIATGQEGPYKADAEVLTIVGTVVGVALSLVGTVFLLLMIYAGYMWMTAHGNEEKVATAKATVTMAVIGIVIVVGAYACWKFLLERLF